MINVPIDSIFTLKVFRAYAVMKISLYQAPFYCFDTNWFLPAPIQLKSKF